MTWTSSAYQNIMLLTWSECIFHMDSSWTGTRHIRQSYFLAKKSCLMNLQITNNMQPEDCRHCMFAELTSHSGLLQNWTSGQRYLEGHGWPPYRCSVCAQRRLQVFCWPTRLHQSPQSQQRSFHSDDSGLHPPQELPSTANNHSFLLNVDSTRPVCYLLSFVYWQHEWNLTLWMKFNFGMF